MRSPDKRRYLNAIRHLEAEEIPFQEDEMEASVAGRILGRTVPMVRSFELPVNDLVELNIRCGNDMVYLSNVWELGRHNVFDSAGRKHYMDGTIKTRSDLARIEYPELDRIRQRIEEVLDGIEDTGLGLKYTANQSPSIVTTAVGYQDYYIALIDDPGFIHEFQKRVDDFCLRELELALSYPIDLVQVGAVICSGSGPMFSRAMIEEFEFPSLRQRVEMIKRKKLPVSLHVDGDVTSLIPDYIAMGIDVLNPIEPCGGRQDIYRLKEQVGDRLALHGNIDLSGVLANGSPAEVRADVEEHLRRLAVGGGYICASSHNITEAVPLANFFAMRDTVQGYRFRA